MTNRGRVVPLQGILIQSHERMSKHDDPNQEVSNAVRWLMFAPEQ
jgi:hypothetical protein